MSFFPPQFQIMSDLHLETPKSSPQYTTFLPPARASNIFLLGDIGLVRDDGLFQFFRRMLSLHRGSRFFYLLGNHEAYQITHAQAVARVREFEEEARREYGGRFHFLHRDRYDLADITILGCTLWSDVLPEQASEVVQRMTDFNEERGIVDWQLEDCMEEHRKDLEWLNNQVQDIAKSRPDRQIIILTHHSPTIDPQATMPEHRDSSMSSGFASDLSQEPCWTSDNVKMWAFGHTHYSCSFYDRDKLVIANQKEYGKSELRDIMVEPASGRWTVDEKEEKRPKMDGKSLSNIGDGGGSSPTAKKTRTKQLEGKSALFKRLMRHIPRLRKRGS